MARRSYCRGVRPNKFTVSHEPLMQALSPDARRPKHERRKAKALYVEIKAPDYDDGYSRVTDFIQPWHQGEGQSASVNAFVPLTVELGEAFQFAIAGQLRSNARSSSRRRFTVYSRDSELSS